MGSVSVVMPVRSSTTAPIAAIRSLVGQTYSQWELLAEFRPDDPVARRMLACAAATDPRIQPIATITTPGRRALAAAQGEFLAFLHPGDLWLPHNLERQTYLCDVHGYDATIVASYRVRHGWQGEASDWIPQGRVESASRSLQRAERLSLSTLVGRRETLQFRMAAEALQTAPTDLLRGLHIGGIEEPLVLHRRALPVQVAPGLGAFFSRPNGPQQRAQAIAVGARGSAA